jgi:hypothetical protein
MITMDIENPNLVCVCLRVSVTNLKCETQFTLLLKTPVLGGRDAWPCQIRLRVTLSAPAIGGVSVFCLFIIR